MPTTYPATQKTKFDLCARKLLKVNRKKFLEKRTLNNFVNLLIIFCPRWHYKATVQIFETVLVRKKFSLLLKFHYYSQNSCYLVLAKTAVDSFVRRKLTWWT